MHCFRVCKQNIVTDGATVADVCPESCGVCAGRGTGQSYTKHVGDFCSGNFDTLNKTFYSGAEPLDACRAKCDATRCACFDVKAAGPVCRLTNYSTGVQASSSGIDPCRAPLHVYSYIEL